MGEPWKRYQSTTPQEVGPWSRYQQQPAPGFDKEKPPAPAQAAAPPAEKKPWYQRAAGEFWDQVNPVQALRGLAEMGAHPIETGKNLLSAQGSLLEKSAAAYHRGDTIEGLRHGINYAIPVLGVGLDAAGDQMQSGDLASGAGTTAGIAANLFGPKALPKVAKLPGKVAAAAEGVSERLYQSALKPSTTLGNAGRKAVLQTGLREGIPVSEDGLKRLHGLVSDYNQKIAQTVNSNPAATINKFDVSSRLGDTAKRFSHQVAPLDDLRAISEVGNEFLDTQPGLINAPAAQSLKQGTYQRLTSRAYGEVKAARTEAEKALARGLKEELERQFPEIKSMNAAESKLYALEPELQRALGRISNHDVLGISTPIAAGGAAVITQSGKAGATIGLVKAILDNPNVKSRIAIAISKGSRGAITVNQAKARLAGYLDALGNAADQSSDK